MLNSVLLPHGTRLKEKLTTALKFVDPEGRRARLPLQIGTTPRELIYTDGALQLHYYAPNSDKVRATPVFIVPSIVNRNFVLDLLPGCSFVEFLTKQGYAVYMIDWGLPQPEDRYLPFEQFIAGRIRGAARAALRHADRQQFHLFGQCLGGTFGTVFALNNPEMIKSMTLLTTPVNFHDEGLLSAWSNFRSLDVDALVESCGGYMPWTISQPAFLSLKPAYQVTKYLRYFALFKEHGAPIFNTPALRSLFALDIWGWDNVSLGGGIFKALIHQFYRDNGLKRGTISVEGNPIRLANLAAFPVLNIAGDGDHIVPPTSTLTPEHLPAGHKVDLTHWVAAGGHLGSLVGDLPYTYFWPRYISWLETHDKAAN